MEKVFKISDEYIELTKLLKATGCVGTGGQAKIVIENRLVLVDDEIETRKRRKIRADMIVQYENSTIKVEHLE